MAAHRYVEAEDGVSDQSKPVRLPNGQFPNGQSGNAAGRRKLTEEEKDNRVAALAAKSKAMPSAVARLVAILDDPEARHADQIAAAKVLLDGLEAQRIELTGKDGDEPIVMTAIDPRRLDTETLKRINAARLSAETQDADSTVVEAEG